MFYEVFTIKLRASQTKHYMIYSVKLSFLLICFVSILNYTLLKYESYEINIYNCFVSILNYMLLKPVSSSSVSLLVLYPY